MPDVPQEQVAIPDDNVAQTSEMPVDENQPEQVTADTTETEAETDEQKNEREISKQKERSEKRALGVQKRIDELTADKYAERAAREALQRNYDAMHAALQAQQQRPQEQDTGEPKREQFDDYEKFIEARADWRADMRIQHRLAQQNEQWRQQRQQQDVAQQATAIANDFQRKLSEQRKAIPDFDEVIADAADVQVGNAFPAIATADNPAALMVYLAKNPDVAGRIAMLSPVLAAREIGKLEMKLSTGPQVSKAPSPGKPVGSKPGSSSEPPEDIEGYMAWAKKNMR